MEEMGVNFPFLLAQLLNLAVCIGLLGGAGFLLYRLGEGHLASQSELKGELEQMRQEQAETNRLLRELLEKKE